MSSGSRPRRALLGALGWALTATGVLAILLLVSDETAGGPVRALIVAGAVLAIAVPALAGGAYRLLRARNRRVERAPGAPPLSARAASAQSLLGAAAVRLGGADPAAATRAVLGDRVRIAESTVRGLPPEELLGFLWFARPSQPEGFASSPEFAGLPEPVQQAIVLLDLRRGLELRGADAVLAATSGFYHHDRERMRAAARASGNPRLLSALDEPRPSTGALLAALDEDRTWQGLLA